MEKKEMTEREKRRRQAGRKEGKEGRETNLNQAVNKSLSTKIQLFLNKTI